MEPQELRIAIDVLCDFEIKANRQLFRDMFGTNLGEHLYQVYSENHQHSILRLWSYLDSGNKEKIVGILSSISKEAPF